MSRETDADRKQFLEEPGRDDRTERIPECEEKRDCISDKEASEKCHTFENVPRHLCEMEEILNEALEKMDELERKIAEYEAFQDRIRKLEAYYTGPQWKEDYAMEEAGMFPEDLSRGVLSQDGIWNMLERNGELLERLGIFPEGSMEQ